MNRFAWLLLLPLGGCAVLEALVEALAGAGDLPKFAYAVTDPSDPFQPTVTIAAIGENDRALLLQNFTDFSADGSVTALALSPEQDWLAIGHVEEGFVIEARTYILDAESAEIVDFQTDNTLSTEIDALCTGFAAAPFIASIPDEVADGNLPPDTDGATAAFFDSPGNELLLSRWDGPDRVIFRARIEMEITFTAPINGDTPIGPAGLFDFYLTLEESGGDWEVTACADAEPAGSGPAQTRNLTLGDPVQGGTGSEILLDGAVLQRVPSGPAAPLGATRLTGPVL